MCPSGPNPPAMSDCMRTIFNGYFTGDRCQCASVFTPAPACEKSPRCYAEITAADVDNPHPTKVCTGSDVMNFSATVEGGCNTATNTTIRVRYRKDLMSVAGISPFSDYFNHVETFLAGGKEYEELSARNPDGSPKLETIALNSTINLHFTARYNPSQALEIQPHSADIYLGAWPSNSMRSVPIRPYFPLTVQPGQTVLDVFPVNTGIASGHNYLQINGDLEFPFFYTYPTQYINPRPMYFVIDTPPPTPSTSGVNTYRFEGLHLLMGAGNKIHMNGDTRIQLLNGSLEGCATMWKGIELEDGSSAELFNNEVKDAQYALHIKGYAIVSAQKTNFENNNLAVYGVIPHNFPSPSIKLSGNTYRSSPGTWKQSYTGQSPAPVNNKGYAGIYLENVSLLNINGYTSPIGGGATDNLFQNLHNGIVVNRVNLNVAKSVFKDITTSALSSGYPLNTTGNGIFCTNGSLTQQGFGDAANSPVSFESCHTAVRANFSMLQVSLNHIIKANFGVRASNTTLKTFTVEHNRIAARDAGIFLHQYAKVPNGCKVSANHVTMTGNSAGVGIRLGGNNLATHIGGNVSDNEVHIQNAAKGIEMQLANQLSVHNNDVYLENSSVNYAGIQANGGSQNGVLCNAVTGSDSLSSTSIRAYQGMSAPAHEWGCNTMSGAPIGMEFAGACDGSDIRGNVFAGVGTGLQIGLAPSTGDAYTGPQSHRGNIWDDASVGVGASYLGNIFQVGQSEFVVDNSILDPITGDDIYKPDAISGPQLWFQTQSAPNGTYSCSSVQQPGYPTNCQPITFTPLRSTRDARQIAGDGIKGDYFQDALQWSTRRHLYRQILEHGNTYGSDTSVLHLLNDAQYTNVRAYGDLEQTLRGTYSVSSADSQQMVDAQLQISDLLLRITRIDSLLNDTSWTYVQRQSLYAQKDTLLVQAQNFIALYGDLNDRLLDDRTTAGNTLLNQYASLSAPSVFEQNEKAVADIYLQTFARDRHDLSATRIQTLESVAFQCPIAGGDAVFLAREMLAAIDTTVRLYDDAALCQNAQKLSGNQYLASAIGGFQLSPNPASGLLHLQYELGTSGRYQFHLTNLLGQNCLTVALKSGRQQESLVMSSLPEGVYFWHILKEAYVIQQGKLVVKR